MTLQTFDFKFLNDVSIELEDRVVENDYGGYRQTTEAGLNSRIQRIPIKLVFLVADSVEAARFKVFLDAHKKTTPFLWAAPNGEGVAKWKFEKYSYSVKSIGAVAREWRWDLVVRSTSDPRS
jgi:phage-related protein